MPPQLTELHLHFQGCVSPKDLLTHLATAKNVDWKWYQQAYKAAYGSDSPARQFIEQFQNGDNGVIEAFERLCVFGDKDAGNFTRFLAKSNLFWAGSYRNDNSGQNTQELLMFASGIKDNFIKQGITYAEF